MRQAPDLLPFNDELPELEDLAPEEIRYLCDLCRKLAQLGACRDLGRSATLRSELEDDIFDRDELGIPPEEDEECLS